jgi:hypothetical protein
VIRQTLAFTIVTAIAVTTGAAPAAAQGAGRWEITAFPGGGMFFTSSRDNSDFSDYTLGASLTYNVNRLFGIEGEIGGGVGVEQDLRVAGQPFPSASTPRTLTYSGNLTYSPAGSDRSGVPYVTGGIGALSMFSRADVTQLGVGTTETFFAGNVGGGVKWFATPRFGLRGDYRLFIVQSKDDAPVFFGRDDTRFGHRVYGGIVITGG